MATSDQQRRQKRMGARIRGARDDKRLSQAALAEMVEEQLEDGETLDQSMISRYEHGRAVPEPTKRRALERILELEPGELQRLLEPETAAASPSDAEDEVVARLSQIEADVSGLRGDFESLQEAVLQVLSQLERATSGEK